MNAVKGICCALLLLLQVGCQSWVKPLGWAGTVQIPKPMGYEDLRLPRLAPDGVGMAVFGIVSPKLPIGHMHSWSEDDKDWKALDVKGDLYAVSEAEWDPEGTRLLFGDTANTWIYDRSTEVLDSIDKQGRKSVVVWGPDAHQITEFVLGSSELDPEQSTRVGYTSLPKADLEYFFDLDGGVLYTGMDWSPDGQKLLVSFHGEDYQNDSSDIFLYDRTTKTLQSIAATDADESGPKWSPDGNWFVYILNPSGADNTELVFASLDTACTIRQTVDSGLMDVSWGHPDLLLVLHRNALYRVDLQLAFGFGQDTIGDHCPN